ncbi:MAG: hypothetical protein BJ554DRAFT_2001, partial [Olpidium bornovanus]
MLRFPCRPRNSDRLRTRGSLCENIDFFGRFGSWRTVQGNQRLVFLTNGCLPSFQIVRNVANLVPPYEAGGGGGFHGVSAAIDYAVNFLHVEDIIVLGHVNCGGIAALMLVRIARDPRERLRFLPASGFALQPRNDGTPRTHGFFLFCYAVGPFPLKISNRQDTQVGEFITPWMSIARRARENVLRKFADSP